MEKDLLKGDEYKNDDLNSTADNARSYQDVIPIIKEYETIMQRQGSILSVA